MTHKILTSLVLVSLMALVTRADDSGHAVEVATNVNIVLTEVETGRFADGWVEITGGDLAAGDQVVVAP